MTIAHRKLASACWAGACFWCMAGSQTRGFTPIQWVVVVLISIHGEHIRELRLNIESNKFLQTAPISFLFLWWAFMHDRRVRYIHHTMNHEYVVFFDHSLAWSILRTLNDVARHFCRSRHHGDVAFGIRFYVRKRHLFVFNENTLQERDSAWFL